MIKTISIIIPAKNEERYLPTLLNDLKQQTRPPNQILLADANSTDHTRDLGIGSGCAIVEGGLPGIGRNAGAKLATGDFLLFLDADVHINDPKFIELALEELETRQLDVAAPDIYMVSGNRAEQFGHNFYNWYVRLWGTVRPHAPGFCTFIRRSLFEDIGGYDPTILFCEDHDLAARAGKRGRFAILNSVTIGVTDRRLRRDGRLVVVIKYILAEVHMMIFGPIRHNLFHYDFGYDEDSPK